MRSVSLLFNKKPISCFVEQVLSGETHLKGGDKLALEGWVTNGSFPRFFITFCSPSVLTKELNHRFSSTVFFGVFASLVLLVCFTMLRFFHTCQLFTWPGQEKGKPPFFYIYDEKFVQQMWFKRDYIVKYTLLFSGVESSLIRKSVISKFVHILLNKCRYDLVVVHLMPTS